MRSVLKTVVFSILVLFGSTGPARAAGLESVMDFIDQLSGPGPFTGIGFGLTILCDHGGLKKCWGLPSGNDREPANRFEITPEVSFLYGQINDKLTYPVSKDAINKRVNAQTFGVQGTYWAQDWLGFNAHVTRVRFSFDQDLTASGDGSVGSTSVSVGPVFRLYPTHRVSIIINPLAQLGLGPFAASDFGATGPALKKENVKFAFRGGIRF